jgi:hypothetical protein
LVTGVAHAVRVDGSLRQSDARVATSVVIEAFTPREWPRGVRSTPLAGVRWCGVNSRHKRSFNFLVLQALSMLLIDLARVARGL